MKIEIEKSEYDRLKSREEKLMAYYEWFVDKGNDLVTVEDIVNKNIELREENKTLKECNKSQSEVINNVFIPQKERLEEENKKLETKLKKWGKALIKLCLKNDYSIIIIDGEEVFNMDNYKIEKKKKPENQKLF